MNILITGYAGFIGFHLTKKLISYKYIKKIYCIDNFNDYYDIKLKNDRHKLILKLDNLNKCKYYKINIQNKNLLFKEFNKKKIDFLFHFAAQAGINYSLSNPDSYLNSNLIGFFNILELVKKNKIKNLIYASTSSVYGNNNGFKLKENYLDNKPLQFYSATKIANEAMAFAYSNLYKFNAVGLRLFTVYGPWGRPDMAIFKFTQDILNKKIINLYKVKSNYVNRDFTYINDVVHCITLIIEKMRKERIVDIFNIGNGKPESIQFVLKCIEKNLKIKSKINIKKLGSAEMNITNCDISKFQKKFNYKPDTKIEFGVQKFIEWFKVYKKLN
tara:strand:- start:121 stop:1107 length:987 start_codon:yes stop_codon:yes gene_type:complete